MTKLRTLSCKPLLLFLLPLLGGCPPERLWLHESDTRYLAKEADCLAASQPATSPAAMRPLAFPLKLAIVGADPLVEQLNDERHLFSRVESLAPDRDTVPGPAWPGRPRPTTTQSAQWGMPPAPSLEYLVALARQRQDDLLLVVEGWMCSDYPHALPWVPINFLVVPAYIIPSLKHRSSSAARGLLVSVPTGEAILLADGTDSRWLVSTLALSDETRRYLFRRTYGHSLHHLGNDLVRQLEKRRQR